MEIFIIIIVTVNLILLAIMAYYFIKNQKTNKNNNLDNDINVKLIELINNSFNTLRDNLEKKMGLEFEKNNKTFVENSEFLNKIKDQLKNVEVELLKTLNASVKEISLKVDTNISKSFEQTNKTIITIGEQVAKLQEAQKNIDSLTIQMDNIKEIFSDKKSRGVYGEVQLEMILASRFGENNSELYKIQHIFSNNKIVDAFIKMPQGHGHIAIDSKFPLENYKNMHNKNLSEIEVKRFESLFIQDIKKHINKISEDYIIANETGDMAVMFVPSEAIFAEINAYFEELILYAQKRNIFIVSPTTLMAFLNVILIIHQDNKKIEIAKIINKAINDLSEEFKRYHTRWTDLEKSINKLTENAREVSITSQKITRRFDDIKTGNLTEKIDEISIEEETK